MKTNAIIDIQKINRTIALESSMIGVELETVLVSTENCDSLEFCEMSSADTIDVPVADLLMSLLHGNKGKEWWNREIADFRNRAVEDGLFLVMDFGERNYDGLDLSGLDLAGARFVSASMEGTNFEDAELSGADLSGVSFDYRTRFKNAVFDSSTNFTCAAFERCDLSVIKGVLSPSQLATAWLAGVKLPREMVPQQIFDECRKIVNDREATQDVREAAECALRRYDEWVRVP